jgi:hypothetical protein
MKGAFFGEKNFDYYKFSKAQMSGSLMMGV